MKNITQTVFYIIIIFTFSLLINLQAYSQTIDFDTKQNLTISAPGFFPFSTVSNDNFKNMLPTNPNLTVQFSNFLGNPCAIAPAADFSEIGPQIVVRANGDIVLDFSNATSNAGQLGLSLVPQGGTCIFDLFIPKPQITTTATTTSSTSGVITISGGGGEDTLTIQPNSITVFSGFLSDSTVNKLSNEKENSECSSIPSGINPITINGTGGNDTIQIIYNELGVINFEGPERTSLLNQTIDEPEVFTLFIPENKNAVDLLQNLRLTNTEDKTKIFATAIFPSSAELVSIMLGATRKPAFKIESTLKEQNNVALGAVQHAIISGGMPWQVSQNGGYFITQGGGCVAPFCVIVEQGMIVVDPDGACNPDKLNKRKANYPTFNPSNFFEQITTSAVELPTSSILPPKDILDTKIVNDNAYLILQPVPPRAKIKQQLKFDLQAGSSSSKPRCIDLVTNCGNLVQCLGENLGKCCEANKDGTVKRICNAFSTSSCGCRNP